MFDRIQRHYTLKDEHRFQLARRIRENQRIPHEIVNLSLMPENAVVLTIEFKINLLSPAKGKRFRAVGKVKKPGKNITVTEGELFSHEESGQKLVATIVATIMSVYNRDGIEN